MKISSIMLCGLSFLVLLGLIATNFLFKKQFDVIDKNDPYWNYKEIFKGKFKNINIDGGNITNILFEENPNSSVKILNYWSGFKKDRTVKISVKNDTLYLKFSYFPTGEIDRRWMRKNAVIHISAPVLNSIKGRNTKLEVGKLNEKSLNIDLLGKSLLEIESNNPTFNMININQSDSSKVTLQMNPDLNVDSYMFSKAVRVNLKGASSLDIRHLRMNSLILNVGDNSNINLLGSALKLTR